MSRTWNATVKLPGGRKTVEVTVTAEASFKGPLWLDRVLLFGEGWEVAAFFDEKRGERFMYPHHGKKKLGTSLARSCWNGCAGIEDGSGEPCHIHFPNVKVQAVDLKVPAVSWKGKWWVVDQETAQRIARRLAGHD